MEGLFGGLSLLVIYGFPNVFEYYGELRIPKKNLSSYKETKEKSLTLNSIKLTRNTEQGIWTFRNEQGKNFKII